MRSEELTLEEGLSANMKFIVGENDTAKSCGSGKSDILATPVLVRYMEATAQKIADMGMPSDWQTIGTLITVEHSSATPVGICVEVNVRLVSIDEKNLSFEISAFDNCGQIASGIHKRIVTKTATLERLLKKKIK